MKEHIKRELDRKQKFLDGQLSFSEQNADLRRARQVAKEEAAKALQKLERDNRENTKSKQESDEHQKYVNDEQQRQFDIANLSILP